LKSCRVRQLRHRHRKLAVFAPHSARHQLPVVMTDRTACHSHGAMPSAACCLCGCPASDKRLSEIIRGQRGSDEADVARRRCSDARARRAANDSFRAPSRSNHDKCVIRVPAQVGGYRFYARGVQHRRQRPAPRQIARCPDHDYEQRPAAGVTWHDALTAHRRKSRDHGLSGRSNWKHRSLGQRHCTSSRLCGVRSFGETGVIRRRTGGLRRLKVRNPNQKSPLMMGSTARIFTQRTGGCGEAGDGRGAGLKPSPRIQQ
jgi:hypothetical protein